MSDREPVWGLALAGVLLAGALAPRATPRGPDRAALPPSLATATARELRAVPGLGERRALALVDARWKRPAGAPPLLLGDVPGVGPVSEGQVALWLSLARAAVAPRW